MLRIKPAAGLSLLGSALVLGASLAHSQPRLAAKRSVPRATRQVQPAQSSFTFGDITLRGYIELRFIPGRSVTAEGPNEFDFTIP